MRSRSLYWVVTAWTVLVLVVSCWHGAAAQSTNTPVPPRAEMASQVLVMLHMALPHYRADSGYSTGYADDAGRVARRRVAESVAADHHLRLVAGWPMPILGVDCFVMEADRDTVQSPPDVQKVIERLSQDERVEWAQQMNDFRSLGEGDPLYRLQPSTRLWHLSDLHQVSTGRSVRIAVIDSGIDDRHPDLAGQVGQRENFIDNMPDAAESHGTSVAGIIAARSGNGAGIVGIASGARLMALRACWEITARDTECNSFTLAKALNFAILHQAQIINLSLTGPQDRLLQRLIDAALLRGIVVVGAVDHALADGGFPASHPGVLAVANENLGVPRAGTVGAPGSDIPTTIPGGNFDVVSGSSYASAEVSGLVALLLQLNGALSPDDIRKHLTLLTDATQHDGRPRGAIDACATVALVSGSCVCTCPVNHADQRPR